jgi:hypothetical protein
LGGFDVALVRSPFGLGSSELGLRASFSDTRCAPKCFAFLPHSRWR